MARRRNSGRTAPPALDATPPLPSVANKESLFSFVTPTELVDLPSKGMFYAEDHPLRGVETLEIKHMTAKEEDILTSETLLRNGVALERLLRSVIVDKSVDPNSLLIGDKNALLIAVRETGFGSVYTTNVACPSCGILNEKDFSLENKTYITPETPDDVASLDNGNFLLNFEKYNLSVELRLLTGADEINITRALEKRKKMKLESANVTSLLKNIIVAVNDSDDPEILQSFVEQVPASLSRKIRSTYDSLMPNVQVFNDFTCDSCSHTESMEVPITIGFFWPDL